MLKNMIYKSDCDVYQLSWEEVNHKYKEGHQNFLALVDIILSLPTSSADAERGFSEMKMVKTDWRCRLRSEVLNDLMHIQFNTQDVLKFNPLPAIHLWNSSAVRPRRPFYNNTDENNNYSSDEEDLTPLYSLAKKVVD
ncbi:uncharacterized protein LOC133182710 [Saccostrea echinata]|uniref:uncharacterized protein LOC133182710 n=1 Tax=Saccostrea echinata TaxID=191078 RepID=UPI002A7F7010|nr:uncharacterized protein LOC133182710 [Saccostrea echinata]